MKTIYSLFMKSLFSASEPPAAVDQPTALCRPAPVKNEVATALSEVRYHPRAIRSSGREPVRWVVPDREQLEYADMDVVDPEYGD